MTTWQFWVLTTAILLSSDRTALRRAVEEVVKELRRANDRAEGKGVTPR